MRWNQLLGELNKFLWQYIIIIILTTNVSCASIYVSIEYFHNFRSAILVVGKTVYPLRPKATIQACYGRCPLLQPFSQSRCSFEANAVQVPLPPSTSSKCFVLIKTTVQRCAFFCIAAKTPYLTDLKSFDPMPTR